MAHVVPFRAIRPTRDKVSLVATRSYLSYSKETLEEKLINNPYTFLHIINPKFSSIKEDKNYSRKFKLVKDKFEEFRKEGIFINDQKKQFYIYQKINENGDKFTGIIGAASVQDYLNGHIKIHEQTIEKREHLFKNYLEITGFNAEPVLLTYPNHPTIDAILELETKKRPEYDFTTTNKALHRLWLVDQEHHIKAIMQSFDEIENLYIADGHHRFASSALVQLSKKKNEGHAKDYCMSFLIAQNQLKIINYNRLISDLNGLSTNEFLELIAQKYMITKKDKAHQPSEKDEISLYLEGQWYSLIAKNQFVNRNDVVEKLDPALLSTNILKPILNITNPRNDKRLSFVEGNVELSQIEQKINLNQFKAAFILKAVTVKQLKDVANEGKSMPPKSTYIQPKLRSGLIIYNLNQ